MIAVDRYVAICHPLRYSQLATAARARALVVLLASLTLVLGMLGAAGFSVYHSLPVTSTAATPHSPPTHVVTSTSSVDAERDACTPATNQTVCSTTSYALVNTGLCGRSDLLLSAGFCTECWVPARLPGRPLSHLPALSAGRARPLQPHLPGGAREARSSPAHERSRPGRRHRTCRATHTRRRRRSLAAAHQPLGRRRYSLTAGVLHR